jgi:hypothetical protein
VLSTTSPPEKNRGSEPFAYLHVVLSHSYAALCRHVMRAINGRNILT